MTARVCAPLALALAASLGLAAPTCAGDATAAAPAPDVLARLVGDWRPRLADTADPRLAPIDCAPADSDCVEEHGTFVSDSFVRLVRTTTAPLAMTSDGALAASLAAREGRPRVFDVAMDGGGRATLHWRSTACGDEPACFEIAGSTDPTALADGPYVPVVALKPDKSLGMTLQNRFGSVPPNMDLAGHCYDVTQMGVDSFTDQQGCGQQIFMRYADMGPYEYTDRSFGDERNVAIPFGWKYVPISQTFGANNATILDSADDVMDSHERTIGGNVSVGLGPVNFSVSHNETTRSRIEDMYARSLTYSEYRYIKTDFALVLDKANAHLAPPFYEAILEQSRRAKPDFTSVIANFGTHYAYATTMGERGRLLSTITQENVSKLHDQGIDVSTTVSVGVSEGEVSVTGGVTVGSKDEHLQKLAATLGEDFGSYVCEGGLACNGQTASGGVSVPVLLDLRPLSDLLAPPFFSEIDDLPALRAAFAKAIAAYAFSGDPASQEPSARFLLATGASYGCEVDTEETASIDGQERSMGSDVGSVCAMTGVTVAGPGATMAFADGPEYATLASTGTPLLLPAGSGATLTGSAMVAHAAASCALAANQGNDQTLLTPGTATGSAAIPTPPPAAGLTLELSTKCGETSGDRSVKGRAFLTVGFAQVSAAQALTR